MRLYELARLRGEPAHILAARLRSDGEWVTSHLSVVPDPVLRRYLPPEMGFEPPSAASVQPNRVSRGSEPLSPPPAPPRRLPRLIRRPGPRPVSVRHPGSSGEYGDPASDLRYEPELTTRDVAALLRVTQTTVRKWVARGHLRPTRQEGSSNVFDTEEVLDAFDLIAAGRKATGEAPRSDGYFARSNPADRIHPKHYDAIVTINEAARLVQVSPSTIRSWMHRGHLAPARSVTTRPILLRVEDVVQAARDRRLPQPVPAWRQPKRFR